jgi:N-acetyl-gamma-glutamyl-phosphate reductase
MRDMPMAAEVRTIGLVGARGHTGAELIRLVAGHPGMALAFVSSRELEGQLVREHVDGFEGELRYTRLAPAAVAAAGADAVVLALPNGASEAFVAALDAAAADTFVIDLSADHRFDADWHYGLPELTRKRLRDTRRIANPGCYATAMQLAIAPLADALAGPPACFGVSGYSGAGTSPSARNDPALLRGNLMPYALVDHLHEREVAHQFGVAVDFMPHVGAHFRGIMLTVNMHLCKEMTLEAVRARYRAFHAGEALVRILDDAPWVGAIAGRHHAEIGGFALAPDGRRVVVVATLDNLLKGAATQAMQNLNLVFGFDEFASIPLDGRRPDAAIAADAAHPASDEQAFR